MDSIATMVPMVGNSEVKAMRTGLNATFEEINQSHAWMPYDSAFVSSSDTAIWLKFSLQHTSSDSVLIYLHSLAEYNTIYQKVGSGYSIFRNGKLLSPAERNSKAGHDFTPISLPPFQQSEVIIRLNRQNRLYLQTYPQLYSERGHWQKAAEIRTAQAAPIGFIYFYLISLFTIFAYATVIWLRNWKKLFFYYLGYLFFQLIYGFQVLQSTGATTGNIFAYIPKLSAMASQPTQFMIIGFYVFFISNLLSVKKYDKLLSKTLSWLGIFCFAYAGFRFIVSYFFYGQVFEGTLFIAVRSIILPVSLILFFWIIYKVKHPLLKYFIVGQSFFFIGAVLASYIGFSQFYLIPEHPFNFVQAPNIIFQVGLLAEVYCFSLAMGKKVLLLQQETEKVQDELIAQLQENHTLQEEMNHKLDIQIQAKTKELIQLYSEIEAENARKTEEVFAQKLRETEMVALRAQMNPHFIFNSLSAIKHLIMSERKEDAIAYLDDFSLLLREILNNSNRKKITVEEELEILELYLSIEQKRMGRGFEYSIEATSREALSQYQIPPLLLQPIVENALWHGLHPSLKANKRLLITFDTSENLKIVIEDNGIGRAESAKQVKLHKPLGSSIVSDRLSLHNHLNEHNIFIETTDLEENDAATGTRVTLTYEY